eukprot:6014231-Prymnesium_polylepis.1
MEKGNLPRDHGKILDTLNHRQHARMNASRPTATAPTTGSILYREWTHRGRQRPPPLMRHPAQPTPPTPSSNNPRQLTTQPTPRHQAHHPPRLHNPQSTRLNP